MKLLQIIQTVFGIAEEIVPVFIHNPTSQKIEGVIVTTLNGALGLASPAVQAAVTNGTVTNAATPTPAPVGTVHMAATNATPPAPHATPQSSAPPTHVSVIG